MQNFLQRLLGGAPERTAIPAPQTYSRKLEAAARKQGFRNAEAMVLWHRQQQTGASGPPSVRGAVRGAIDTGMSWHPANILSKISGAIAGATGG